MRKAALAWVMATLAIGRAWSGEPVGGTYTYDHGAIIRGDRAKKQIALVFTGGEYGEGSPHILDVLGKLDIRAAMFVTGGFIRKPEHEPYLKRMIEEGHYLGPHSDRHLLYCSWQERKTVVSEAEFKDDLARNIADLRALGGLSGPGPVYFIPPYEWYNQDQVRWSSEIGVLLFSFSPGSGSNRDYLPESERGFVGSEAIHDDILSFEKREATGLNGFVLLMHLGARRSDKMFLLLEPLLRELQRRGYTFVRIDELIPS